MASKGDEAGIGGTKDQVGETEFLEKLNSIRMLLSEANSEDSTPDQASKLMNDLTKNTQLAKEINELLDLVLTQNLPIEKILLVNELLEEAMPLSFQRNGDILKRIASLFQSKSEGKPAEKEDKYYA